ncbi:hypothetical protein NUU61_005229 [Penicillium alfredii]|uniref:Uncharacterized protein n=1 Tax=Penicillium alfredii TaxID=1506179 RepID=A0A9W9F960_9EURO|nr:uncharacterized protein NUU61_005229 [Penicillium alfredii]KAJ5095873.1 hypothetical protein NUU61_005229 [Penicillium alfredii]
MARSAAGLVSGQPWPLLLLSVLVMIRPSNALNPFYLLPRSTDSCPSSYKRCGSSKLPDSFCCPSSATCISLDDASSAICCPTGANCDYISPIVCDAQQQNATLHPKNPIKTTRLDDELPECGDSCCPFGYTCQGNSTCALNRDTSSKATATLPGTSTTATASTTESTTLGATFTPVSSPSSSLSANSASGDLASQCPSFPSKAVVAGVFPGAVFGAVLALLASLCLRRRARKNEQQAHDPKSGPHWSERSSNGTLIGISNPIASDDISYRTDFLLRPGPVKRSSLGGRSTRSVLHRTGTRVRSLFSGTGNPKFDKDIPPVPAPAVTPPERQASTESIKVFSPPGAFAQSNKFLGPEPYPGTIAQPDTTFTDLMQVVGFSDGKGEPCYRVTETPQPQNNPFRD